jgi:hypothetical protein
MSCALQTQLETVPLGRSIVRIVQMIVALVQTDMCGLGLSSSAMYAALRAFAQTRAAPRAGTTAFDAAVTGLDELVLLGGDKYARLVFEAACSARRGKWTTHPTPYTSDTPTVLSFDLGACAPYTDARLTALVASLDAAVRLVAASPPCGDRAAARTMVAGGIASGLDRATCAEHVESAMRALAVTMGGAEGGAVTMGVIAGHPAMNTIRAEIAYAFCGQAQAQAMTAAGFAEHVADVLVDGACGLQAALRA